MPFFLSTNWRVQRDSVDCSRYSFSVSNFVLLQNMERAVNLFNGDVSVSSCIIAAPPLLLVVAGGTLPSHCNFCLRY
jgi:hypothetical protein